MTSIKRRILMNLGANTLGKSLSVCAQIVSVPILLHHWGTRVYGEWILLSTIPMYFAMSDIGFGNVAGNEMTMLTAAGKRNEALEVFQSISLLITAISIALSVLLAPAIWYVPIERWFQIRLISIHDARLILLLLGLSSLLTLQEVLFHASFRCIGKYALGTTAKSAVQLGTFLGVIVSVSFGATPLLVATITMLINAAGTFALWWLLRRQIDWIRYGVRHARLSTIRRLLVPAVSFMSFPVSSILQSPGHFDGDRVRIWAGWGRCL